MRRMMAVFVVLALLVSLAHAQDANLEKRVAALEAKVEEGGGMAAGDFKVYWDNGLRIDIPSVDGKIKIGGRIYNDRAFFQADNALEAAVGDNADGTEFRAARLYVAGNIQKNYEFKAQYDMAGGDALPSIRRLAREQRISVITVQRAYDDLEQEGLVQSRRGKGFWVAPIPEGRKQKMAEERFADGLKKLVANARAEGLSAAAMRRILSRLLRKGTSR